MNKSILCLFIIASTLFICSSCKSNNEVPEKSEYPEVNIIDYSSMDTYTTSVVKDTLEYDYTFYFDENKCVNALITINFDNFESLNEYYETIKESNEYLEISVENNKIKYYHNPEYFTYMLYSKEMIIDLFDKENLVE